MCVEVRASFMNKKNYNLKRFDVQIKMCTIYIKIVTLLPQLALPFSRITSNKLFPNILNVLYAIFNVLAKIHAGYKAIQEKDGEIQ